MSFYTLEASVTEINHAKKQEMLWKRKQQNVCKTVAMAIEMVAVEAAGNRYSCQKQRSALKKTTICMQHRGDGDQDGRGGGGW